MSSSIEIIDATVAKCVGELLGSFRLAPSILPEARSLDDDVRDLLRGENVLAFLGFGGDLVVGTLVIAMPETVATKAATMSVPAQVQVTPRIVGDWMGELSNQLLGRIKNVWLRRKVKLIITIPQTITCRNLILLGNSGVSRRTYYVSTVAGLMQITFDCVLPRNFAFPDEQATDDAAEGDLLFF